MIHPQTLISVHVRMKGSMVVLKTSMNNKKYVITSLEILQQHLLEGKEVERDMSFEYLHVNHSLVTHKIAVSTCVK